MPHKQNHRGANPRDAKSFSDKQLPDLKQALEHLNYLLSRDYNPKSSLKLVGDRFRFTERQRRAIAHSACGEKELKERRAKHVSADQIAGKKIAVDGYNQLITMEAALSKAPVFIGTDGCYRDIASVHGTYRRVEETIPALELFAKFFEEMNPEKVLWVFDKPISNSGRLKQMIQTLADEKGWRWDVTLDFNPDKYIAEKEGWIAVSSDSWVLDNSDQWLNLNAYLIDKHVPDAWLIDFENIKTDNECKSGM
ncbi:hypothetical protein FUAX_42330 (plasmid) [Fulvitalea axinellae]|uniref:DUF434 domain-containing protein n=1 Tax=Fulvitalea axinellae TaxID=1182444 RepID=A0AAU9DF81_9BACT|nr:hypothetical protein FUAX_42330 [Fulvitalea axinellae]